MNNARQTKTNSQKNLILKTAGKTTAILVVLLVLFSALFMLLAPMRASDFLYSVGAKNLSATMAYSSAKDTNNFDDWWSVLVKAADAKSYSTAYEAADRLENHKDYNSKISYQKITIDGEEYNGKYYVAYQKAKNGLLANPSKTSGVWNYCKLWYKNNGWGEYLDTNYYSSNAVKGYIDALIENKEIEMGDVMQKLDDLYSDKGDFANNSLSSSQEKDLAYYVANLINNRGDDVSESDKALWNGRI